MYNYVRSIGGNFSFLGGNGTWNGPISAIAVLTDNSETAYASLYGGFPRLVLNGTITQSGAPVMNLNLNGTMPGTITLNQPLNWNGAITLGDNSTNTDTSSTTINTLELNAAGNSFTNFSLLRGKLRIGVDNAFPSNCPFSSDHSLTGVSSGAGDHRAIIDLNGHVQTIANINGGAFASLNNLCWIGNDSTTNDATFIYDVTGNSTNVSSTNIYTGWICDNLDGTISPAHKTTLKIMSGGFHLYNNSATNHENFVPSGPTNNTYSGPTLVQGGIFQCDAPLPNSSVTISGTGTLRGSGPFFQPMTNGLGGTLSPGGDQSYSTNLVFKLGNMTNYSTLTLAAGSTTLMKVLPQSIGGTNDNVRWLKSVTYGGTLSITNIGTSAANLYANGRSFKLFTATNYFGSFGNIVPFIPTNGLVWDTSSLAINGVLKVANVSQARPVLATSFAGGNVTISWPADHAGWRLTMQTNALNVGFQTNASAWVTVPNSTNTLTFTAPIDKTTPTVFYRLVYP
jgi:hypothetical protein